MLEGQGAFAESHFVLRRKHCARFVLERLQLFTALVARASNTIALKPIVIEGVTLQEVGERPQSFFVECLFWSKGEDLKVSKSIPLCLTKRTLMTCPATPQHGQLQTSITVPTAPLSAAAPRSAASWAVLNRTYPRDWP